MATYYSNALNQRTFQPSEFNNYNSRNTIGKPATEQYQALPNVGQMTISKIPIYNPSNNQSITNYHYVQMDKNPSSGTAKYPSQSSNQNAIQNTPISTYSQPKGGFHDTLNRNFFNSQYVYQGQRDQMPQYAPEKRENTSQPGNENYNYNNPSTTLPKTIQTNSAIGNMNSNNNYNSINQRQIAAEYQNSQGFKPPYMHGNFSNIPQRIDNTPMSNIKNVPKVSYVVEKWSSTSKPGKEASGLTKMNQDSYLYKESKINGQTMNLVGVFDGHGPHGHFVSKAIKTFFTNAEFSSNKTDQYNNSYYPSQSTNNDQQTNIFNDKTNAIIKQKFEALSHSINTNKAFDSHVSGSTCVVVFISDNKLICANCGDSRAIMVLDNGGVVPLSRDHKPELPDEMDRIIRQGGRVEQVQIPYLSRAQGPFRVWLKHENYPGLAMSRSIGDQIAKSIGVTAEPEISEFNLIEAKPKFLIVASDGVWEFLSNHQVTQIVMPYYSSGDCDGASKRLVEVSLDRWMKEESVVDDITAVVVFFTQSKS